MNRRKFCQMLCAIPFMPSIMKDALSQGDDTYASGGYWDNPDVDPLQDIQEMKARMASSTGKLPPYSFHVVSWPATFYEDFKTYEICRVYTDEREVFLSTAKLTNWCADKAVPEDVIGYNVYLINIQGDRIIHYQERFKEN